jgi:hypothetical protein
MTDTEDPGMRASGTDDLDAWLRELCLALDVPCELAEQRALLLDVAREAAHGVMRPAAPLTTFLVGYAAGRAASGAGNSEGASHDIDAVIRQAAGTAMSLALSRVSQPET